MTIALSRSLGVGTILILKSISFGGVIITILNSSQGLSTTLIKELVLAVAPVRNIIGAATNNRMRYRMREIFLLTLHKVNIFPAFRCANQSTRLTVER